MNRRSGFTLVELVVVILILGILAGVAAPKFFQTSGSAADSGAKQSLAVVRDAIELYAANNNGQLPPGAALPAALVQYIRGPFPTCPVGANDGSAAVFDGVLSEGTGQGWAYDDATGAFIINSDDPASGGGTYNQW